MGILKYTKDGFQMYAYHILMISPSFIGMALLYMFPQKIIIPFLIIYIFQLTQGRSERFRNLLKDYINPKGYFKDFTIDFEEDLKPNHCLIVSQPHNIFSYSQIANYFSEEKLKSFRLIGSRAGLNLPFFGLTLRWLGVSPAHPDDFKTYMEKGQNLLLVPGGFEEATMSEYNKINLFTKKRKGFIKFALIHGYTVYPMVHIGEEMAYKTLTSCLNLRLMANKVKMPGVVPLHIFPYRSASLNTVVGKGILFPVINDPSKDEINQYHGIYLKSMEDLFEKYQKKFNNNSKIEYFGPKL